MFKEIQREIEKSKDSLDFCDKEDAIEQLKTVYHYRVIGRLTTIFEFSDDIDNCTKDLKALLREHWQIIKNSHLDYFNAYDNPVNQLLISIAKTLSSYDILRAQTDFSLTPKSSVEYLMPGLYPQLIESGKYSHFHCTRNIKTNNWRDVDIDSVLRASVLGRGERCRTPTPLLTALDNKQFDIAAKLFDIPFSQNKLDLNAATIHGETALMLAAKAGQDKLCRKILELGWYRCQSLSDYQAFRDMLAHRTINDEQILNVVDNKKLERYIGKKIALTQERIAFILARNRAHQEESRRRNGFFSRCLGRRNQDGHPQAGHHRCSVM